MKAALLVGNHMRGDVDVRALLLDHDALHERILARHLMRPVHLIDIVECLLHWRFLKSKSQLPKEPAPRPFGEPNRGVCGAHYIKAQMQAQGGK